MRLWLDEIDSPIGRLRLVVVPSRGTLCALDFEDSLPAEKHLAPRFGAIELEPTDDPCGYSSRLRDYFSGQLGAFDTIPVEMGGTPFQALVWSALRRIRPGETMSYGALAAAIGRAGASRAVGLANGRNPVAIVVPCHRVIGSNGTLTGYGGGLDRKKWLLEHERAHVAPALFSPSPPRLGRAAAGAR